MKIGIDGREFAKGKITGIGRFLYTLLSYLIKEKPEWKFYIFLNQNCELNLEFHNLYKIYIPEKITFVWDQIKLLAHSKRYQLDLFYSPYYKFPIFSSTPIVTTIFDIIYLLVEPYKNYVKYKLYVKNFIKFTSEKVKKIITCSNTAKNDLINILGIKEDKIEVIYLCVDEKFQPQPYEKIKEVKKKYNIDSKYILYVGNSKPHKNLFRLIKAYNLLPKDLKKEYILILAGVKKTDFPHSLLIADYSLLLIESISDDDLPSLYSGAELFVFPSLCEGFGLPPVEAMSCGCPVVAAGVSSIPEVLGNSALYFDPYNIYDIRDKIFEILTNQKLKEELSKSGFNHVKQFTRNNMGEKFINILSSITKV
ncbi:MAG: glycosyltransferase family 4 protein [Endomicrobia bacterium]|nr:glycosyltransferase family 4 protein [Endomicrobiia bacterium]